MNRFHTNPTKHHSQDFQVYQRQDTHVALTPADGGCFASASGNACGVYSMCCVWSSVLRAPLFREGNDLELCGSAPFSNDSSFSEFGGTIDVAPGPAVLNHKYHRVFLDTSGPSLESDTSGCRWYGWLSLKEQSTLFCDDAGRNEIIRSSMYPVNGSGKNDGSIQLRVGSGSTGKGG